MATNIHFNMSSFGYPNLGSSYTPNFQVEARVERFLNAQSISTIVLSLIHI